MSLGFPLLGDGDPVVGTGLFRIIGRGHQEPTTLCKQLCKRPNVDFEKIKKNWLHIWLQKGFNLGAIRLLMLFSQVCSHFGSPAMFGDRGISGLDLFLPCRFLHGSDGTSS